MDFLISRKDGELYSWHSDQEIDIQYVCQLMDAISDVLSNRWPTRKQVKSLSLNVILDHCFRHNGLQNLFYHFIDKCDYLCDYPTEFDSQEHFLRIVSLLDKDRKVKVFDKALYWLYVLIEPFQTIDFDPKLVCKVIFPNRIFEKMNIPDGSSDINEFLIESGEYDDTLKLLNQFFDNAEQQNKYYDGLNLIKDRFDAMVKKWPSIDRQIKECKTNHEQRITKELSEILCKDDSKARFTFNPGHIFVDNVDSGIRNENSRIVIKTLVEHFGKPVEFIKLLPIQQKLEKMAQQPLRDAKTDINHKLKNFGLHIRNIRGTGYILENI